jgi:SAM-dependent methyltransferase
MTNTQIDYIVFLHEKLDRQGPGSDWETLKAIELSGLSKSNDLNILDLGCGTGAQTKILAENLHGTIYAIDLFQRFIDELTIRVPYSSVKSMVGSMDKLTFEHETFDLIWSEGAIYNMGFANGVNYLRPYLKENGVLSLSEVTWLTNERPKEIGDYWNTEYPEIATAAEKINVLENSGYKLIDHFILSEESWINNYYGPLEQRLKSLVKNSSLSDDYMEVVNSYYREIDLYNRFRKYFGYGFYVVRKIR